MRQMLSQGLRKCVGVAGVIEEYADEGVDEVVEDLNVLMNFAEERNVIYSNNVFTCSNCNLEGNKALVFGHVLNSVNRDCKIEDIWYKSESTMEELISNFNNKITQIEISNMFNVDTRTFRRRNQRKKH